MVSNLCMVIDELMDMLWDIFDLQNKQHFNLVWKLFWNHQMQCLPLMRDTILQKQNSSIWHLTCNDIFFQVYIQFPYHHVLFQLNVPCTTSTTNMLGCFSFLMTTRSHLSTTRQILGAAGKIKSKWASGIEGSQGHFFIPIVSHFLRN